MGKINFEKTEQVLQQLMESLFKGELLKQTEGDQAESLSKKRAELLLFLKRWSRHLSSLKCPKSLLKRVRQLETSFSEEEWTLLERQKEALLIFLKEKREILSDEELIEKEKLRHETKRFNVNERWLPLD